VVLVRRGSVSNEALMKYCHALKVFCGDSFSCDECPLQTYLKQGQVQRARKGDSTPLKLFLKERGLKEKKK